MLQMPLQVLKSMQFNGHGWDFYPGCPMAFTVVGHNGSIAVARNPCLCIVIDSSISYMICTYILHYSSYTPYTSDTDIKSIK